MNHSFLQLLTIVVAILSLTAAQGFYTQRYGKRADGKQIAIRSGLYANRYGRSSPSQEDLPEIKIRSSRFIGGSRYGKRSGASLVPEVPSIVPSASEGDSEAPAALIVGESVVCLLIDVPDVYKCLKKSVNEESTN